MAYFGFFKIDGAPATDPGPPAPGSKASNAFSDSSAGDRVQIEICAQCSTDDRGRVSGAPPHVVCTIRRQFALSLSKKEVEEQMLPANGSLILYQVAVLSTQPSWNCREDAKDKWPGLVVHLNTQNDTPFKYELRRLLVDHWELNWTEKGDKAVETLALRAFEVTQTGSAGQQSKLSIQPPGR